MPRTLCAKPDEHAAVETLRKACAERKKACAALEKAEKAGADAIEEAARDRKDAATEAVKEALVPVAAAARKVAEALAAACLGLLDQNAADADYVASLPSWLQGFDAGNRLAGAAWHGVGFLQKDKKYAEANEVLRALMKHG